MIERAFLFVLFVNKLANLAYLVLSTEQLVPSTERACRQAISLKKKKKKGV